MDNNSESQKNLSEINFSTATDVSDSKSDPPPGSSPKKPIQLGVVQSSLGNRTSTSSFNKKSRWDQAPESGEETETKESKTELQDVEQSTSVKHLIQKFENITGDSQLVEKQCEELPIKPVAAHTSTPSRVKLVRTNFMKIDKPTPNLGKTGADDLAASSSQGKDNILKQLTPQTSTTEATEIKDIKSVTPSTALEIISSCYDSPSDESSQDTDISSTSGNKTKDSVSLEKLNDPLKDDTNIESKSDIHTEKNLTSEINVDTDIQLDEDSSSRSRISSKEDTVDFEVVTVGDVSSYTQSLSGKNTPIEDSTKEKTHPCNIRNTKNDINSKINLSSVGELLPQPSTFVIHEIKSDPLTKSDGNVTVSSKVLDHTQTSELKNPAINKEGKYRELNEDSPNNVIGNDDSDLSEFSKDVQEETVNPPNVSKLVDTKTAQKSICSIDLSEKSETDEDNSKLLTQITPATENISSQDQLETGESKTDIKTSLVEENVLLHEEIIESKTEGNIDGGQNNILKTVDSSLKTSEGNNASVSSFGSFSESSSKICGTDVNSKDQKPSSSSITSNESEKKEYFELPVNVGKTPVIEEVCVKKHMYITGDNINISEDINLNENKDILTDTIESNTTENISLYNDGVDATMEKMFSDNLESGDEILAPVEESNKEDTILSKSIKSPKASVLSEDILSTNENKETSCFERNKNKIIETSDSLLEMLESESSPSCNDTKKDIHQHHTKLHIPITGTNTLNEPDILTKTLNSYKEESCVSSEENISIDNKNNLEVETTSEHQQITRINVEDSLKSVNIETIDIEKCSQDKSKMSPPNIPKFDATVESLVHKDTVLLSPERNNDSLNAEVTKEPANKRPVSFEQSENIEESIMLKHSESAEDLQKTGLQVETKKDSPSIKSNILNIGEMDTNDSLINSKDNQLNTVVISTEIDTQLNITPSKIEAESKVRKPDSILEKLAEEKHSLINIERNEELEQIIEDTEIYETSASTHLSSLVEEDDTQKSNCVKGDGKSFEVSTKVNETIKEHFSDNTVVYSKDYDLPLNEDHSESMSHKETQKENTDVLATDQNKIEEIVSQSFVERQTKEAMAPTEQDPTVVAVQSELSPFQINLKSNNEENKHFLTVETSELINNAIIDSKTLSSVETLEVNNDISLDGNRENITIDTTEDNLIQIEECETLESGKLEKHTSPNDGTCSSQQHLLNIDSSIEDKLLSPEKNCTSKINPVVNPSNNEQISMLDLRETGNLSIHEDIETENLQVNTLESEIKNIQNTTSLNTELDDSCNIMLQNTTVDIEEKQQHMEIETSMGEQPINCSEIILKAENKDCKGIVQEVKLVTQPKPDVPVVVSSKEESRKIALESEHSLENKSMYDFDKPTCSGEGDSEAFITEEAEVKQEDIAINESDRMEECLQLKSADKDKMPDSKDEGNMSLGHSNQEEIDEIMITEVKSKVDAESLAVVGVEDVPCEQSVTSPKENSSFDHKTLIDTKTDVIDSNKEKYIGESSQLSSHIQMENCQVIDIKHSDELHLDRKLSQVAQPDTKVDLSELDNLPDKNSTKCLDEEENLDKLIPDVSNDTTEITCDDSEAETIQAIDLFLQDTDSENKEETEPKTNKNDDKTEMEVFDSRDNTTQKIEDVDIDPSLELRENPLVDRDSEINEGYMETSQEKEISKDRTVQKQSENLRDNFSDEEIFDQSPNMSFDQEISQTGSSHKEENECKAEEHLIYNPENVSDKENLLKEVPEIVESNTKSNLLPQSPNILEPDSISLDIKDSSSKENEGELDEPVKNRESSTREPEIVTKSCSGQDKLVSSSPLDFQVKHLSAELEVESTAKSTDIEKIQEDKKQKKEICHPYIDSVKECEVELVQESKFEKSETILEVALKNIDSSNKQLNTPTVVFKKSLGTNDDKLTEEVSKDNSNSCIVDINETLPLVENQEQKLKPDVEQHVLGMSLEMPMPSIIDTSDSQLDNNLKETLTINENNEFTENSDIPPSNKSCMHDAKVTPGEEIGEISLIETPIDEEKVADTDNIYEQNKELPDNVPISVLNEIKKSEQTTTRSDEAAAVIESEDNNSCTSIENKPEVKEIEESRVILETKTLLEEEKAADTTNNVTDDIIEQNNVLPDKFPIVVDKSSKQTTTESGETVNINAGNNSSSILSVFNELEVQSLEEIEELPKIKTDVKEKKTGGTTHVTGNISEQNKISSNKLPLITVDDNNSNKQTTTESNEAPINNAGGNISTSSSIENKPEVKQFERIEELPNVETPIEDGKSTDIINNVISDINEQSKILPDKLQITVEGDIKINKQRIPGSDEASLINNKANISTSSVVNEREVNSMEEIEVNLMTDTLIEEKNSSNATKNNDTCDTIGINKIILPDKLPITVEDDVKSNKQIKPKNDQVPVINSGDNESSISAIETKPELQAVEEIKVLSHADITTNEEKVSDCSINVIDNIEEQNKELPDKVPITVVDDIKNNEQTILRSDEAAVISSGDNNSSNSLIENKPEVKPVEDMGVIITKTETLVEEEIVADNTNNVTDVINEQNKVLPDKLTTFAVDGNINNKQTTSDSGDALDTNYGDNSSVLNEPEVKSPEEIEEIPKTETCIEEEKVDDSTNNVTGNINEQNQILSDKLPLTAMDDNTSCKQTSGSDEIPEINIDDNNSTISKQSRKRQKKTSVPDDYEESQEVSPPKKEAKTIDMLNSSNELLSQDTNKLPPQDSEPPTKVTKSPAVKEVPAPVRVSARQKQRQAAAAAALAAEEKAKTTKSSPESFSKKVVIQEKSGDKRVKKSLSPTKELQIKISSSKPEVSKQSPIVSQKSPKDIDTKQSPQFSPKKMLKQLGQDKLEPITLKLSKEENPVIVRSSSLSPKKVLSPLSPQTKTLGYTLKINKDSTKIVPKDSAVSPNTRDASPSSSNTKADLSGKVGYLIKDTGLTITPIAPAETQDQKLSKITLKLSKAGGHPEIKQEKSETWKAIQKLGEIDIVPVEGKPSPENSKRKEKPDQESPEKKIKLGEVTVEPASSGMSKLQGLLTQAPLNQSDDSEDIQFVGFSPSPEKVQPTQQLTYDLGLVKQETEPVLQKKRGRPRKIITPPEIGHSVGQSIPSGLSAKDILAASLQHQTLQQHIQHLQSPVSIIPSEEQECSSTMFPVPLFDLSEDTFMDPTPPTVFPEQVQPQTILRSARGRPIGRSRRSRGSGLLRTSERGGPRGRPRGSRGIKRMLEEMEALSYQDVDEHITLDNIDSEIGPRIPEHSGSQITEKTIALLRKSIEGKREGIEKRARKSDSGDDKNRDSDIDAQVREMKEKIEAAYQAELKFPGKEGKKKTPEKGEGREKKGPPELIPLQKGNTPDKKVKVSSEDVSFRKISTDGTSDSFHGVGKESLKRKLDEENTEHTFENIKRKSTEDSINEINQQGSSQDQSETENLTTEDNSLKESLKESEDGDTMDVDQPVSPEEPEQVVEVKSEPEPPPKPVKPRPKSKAEIKRIKREKDRIRREAKKLAALEALKLAPPPNPFEEDTRMSATDPNGEGIDDPLGSGIKKNRMEVGDPEGKEFTVDQIAEYQWPLQGGELYMIQEQISTYLGVKSFKRKYPDLKRRPVEMEERTFLCDSGLVSESMCDLGLTAVSSSEVLDIMFQDFQEQYEELRKHMREKQARELINKQKERKKFELSLSKSDLKEQAIQSAVSWNSQLNRSRSESRRCHLDLQTWTIQYPRSRGSKMTRPTPRLGNYPVALIPGQYADFYKRYTAQELRYWPVNTVLYGPLQPNERHSTGGSDGSQSESEDSSSSDDSSDSSSDGEGEGTCEEEEKGCKACGGKRGGEALVQCSQCGHNSSTATVWA